MLKEGYSGGGRGGGLLLAVRFVMSVDVLPTR